jgi:hypothetical protein
MKTVRRAFGALVAALLVGAVTASPARAQATDYSKMRGYVDKKDFTSLMVGEDDVHVDIWLPGALLRLVAAVDPELGKLVAGLDLAQAVVVETEDAELGRKLLTRVTATEKVLLSRGWVRLARVKDGTENISVLILNDEDAIHGLTVMVSEGSGSGSFVFANVVGRIDLAAIQQLGERMDIPGLDQINVEKK